MCIDALPCIVCDTSLKNVLPDSTGNQPADGTAFTTGGHFGSTFFDPMDGQQLEINVCDACLTARIDRIAWRRAYRAIECDNTQVGIEYLDSPPTLYTIQDELQEPRQVAVDQLGAALTPRTMWNAQACDDVRRNHEARTGSPEQR